MKLLARSIITLSSFSYAYQLRLSEDMLITIGMLKHRFLRVGVDVFHQTCPDQVLRGSIRPGWIKSIGQCLKSRVTRDTLVATSVNFPHRPRFV